MDPNTITFTKSSNLKSASLDPATGIAEVTFSNGTKYRYANFTPSMMNDWRAAQSAGNWFHSNVKQNPDKYPVIVDAGAAVASVPPGVTPPPPLTATATATATETKPEPKQAESAKPRPMAAAPKAAKKRRWSFKFSVSSPWKESDAPAPTTPRRS